MLIVGAKGHAVEVFQCLQAQEHKNTVFYDDISSDIGEVFGLYAVCKSMNDVSRYFDKDPRFILGLGNPGLRKRMAMNFSQAGGELTSVVADTAQVSEYSQVGRGVNVMHFCMIAPNTFIGEGVLLNAAVTVHHDVVVKEFSEVSPGARLLGRCQIGANVSIGAGAVILPDIIIGDNAIVGAGAVVTKNVKPNTLVKGVPAK